MAELLGDGHAGSAQWRTVARRKIDEIDRLIEDAATARRFLTAGLSCECVSLDHCDAVKSAGLSGHQGGTAAPT